MSNFMPAVTSAPAPYPLQAFPGLLGQLAYDLGASGICPAIVGSELIAFASLFTQGIADVRWANGQRSPIGVPVYLVAGSGKGKSVILKALMEPATRFLSKRVNEADPSIRPAFFIEDATREAIIHHLGVWPVAGLFTDEAGQLRQLLNNAAPTLAKLSDGAPLRHARVSTGRVELINHRLAFLLMGQPQMFDVFMALLGASKGGVGLVNRFLVAMASDRQPNASLHRIRLSEGVEHRYTLRAQELLERTIANVKSKTERPALQLSAEALQLFMALGDEIRKMLSGDTHCDAVAEYAARHSERVLRLAGAFHAFEHGSGGEVPLATVRAADILGRWSLDAFRRMTYQPPKLSQAEQDAQTLERAFRQAVNSSGQATFPLSQVRRSAPNMGLTKSRFERALPILAGQGKVTVTLVGNIDWLQVNQHTQGLFAY